MILLVLHAGLLVYFAVGMMCQDTEAATGSVSAVYGDDYKTGTQDRHTLRLDVTEAGKYGMLYGRADVADVVGDGSAISTRIVGHLGTGLHLAGQLQNANRVSSTVIGAGFSVLKPSYMWGIDLGSMASNYYGDSFHAFGFWRSPSYIGVYTEGWVEYVQSKEMLIMQPSVMYKLRSVSIGTELQYSVNKNGVRGLDEFVPQVKVKWEF